MSKRVIEYKGNNLLRRKTMDSKKIISGYIKPNLVLAIVLLLIPIVNFFGLIIFLCVTLPALLRANKSLKKLEADGKLEAAAAELTSPAGKKFMKGNILLTENYVFCKKTGFVFTYDEMLWTYKFRQTTTCFFIPVKVTDSLYIATKDMKPRQVVAMGKDKHDEIKNTILEIYQHNNNCLVGYTNEAKEKYKEITKK